MTKRTQNHQNRKNGKRPEFATDEGNLPPVAVIGTSRWKASVPEHLQKPLAKALYAMENNDVPNACLSFGECMERCGTNWDHAKPILFFGAQVMGQRWLELRGAVPDHDHIPEWRELTEMVLRGAVELFPDDPVMRHNLGRFLQDTDRNDEALRCYRHTLLLDPDQVETWGNAADLYYQAGDRTTAYECWERACSLEARTASGRLSQAYYWLRTGQYEKGWQAFNDRWRDIVFVRGYGRDKELGGIHWLGGPLPQRATLYLHGEQGLGDHVQFARYVPLLLAHGVTLAGLETRGTLRRWMAATFPDLRICERDADAPPAFTHHCSTMDLPGILGTTYETIPPPVSPGIISSLGPDTYRQWDFTTTDAPRLRVGIAWEGARGNTADRQRSIPHEALIHLADIPGVTWVNLQFSQDANIVGRAWLGKSFVDGTDGCTDTMDTAAVMRGLDLIVTVDTLTLHLAGTLGIPTIALHRFVREWRWGDATFSGEVCPWYPSVQQWCVPAPNNWPALLTRVREEICRRASR